MCNATTTFNIIYIRCRWHRAILCKVPATGARKAGGAGLRRRDPSSAWESRGNLSRSRLDRLSLSSQRHLTDYYYRFQPEFDLCFVAHCPYLIEVYRPSTHHYLMTYMERHVWRCHDSETCLLWARICSTNAWNRSKQARCHGQKDQYAFRKMAAGVRHCCYGERKVRVW